MRRSSVIPAHLTLAVIALSGAARGATFHVRADAPPGGDGLSWTTAFSTIEDAVEAADAASGIDDIWAAGGTYRAPLSGWSLANINIYGGFAGTELQVSERVPGTNESVLTGDQLGDDIELDIGGMVAGSALLGEPPASYADNAAQLVVMTGGVLDGFTISGVNTPGGAAVIASGTTVRRCHFRDNFGGAIITPQTLLVAECSFVRGLRTTTGSAILQQPIGPPNPGAPGLRVFNCRFHENLALSGGCVTVRSVGSIIAGSLFTGNFGHSGGGAIRIDVAQGGMAVPPVEIVACTVTRNTVVTPAALPAVGAGVHVQAFPPFATCSIRSSIITANGASNMQATNVFDIAKASTVGVSSVIEVVRCLSRVQLGILNSGVLSNVPAGIEHLAGNDNVIGTLDDRAGLYPAVTPCIDYGQQQTLPADEADLDSDGNTSEALPVDLCGMPRVFDDPTVFEPNMNTLDIGCAEAQGFAGDFVPAFGNSVTGDTVVERVIVPGAVAFILDAEIRNTGPGIATLTASSATVPAITIASPLSLQNVVLSTAGDIWIGDREGNDATVVWGGTVTPSVPTLSARRIEIRDGRHYTSNRGVTFRTTEGLIVSSDAALIVTSDATVGGGIKFGGGLSVFDHSTLDIDGGGLTLRQSPRPGSSSPFAVFAALPTTSGRVQADGPLVLDGSLYLNLSNLPPEGPSIGQAWTLMTGASRAGTFDTAFLPGWDDRLTRLVYSSSLRSASVTAQVESRDNVISFAAPLGFPVPGTPSAAAAGKVHAAAYPHPDLAVVVPDPVDPTGAPGTLHVLINQGATATAWNGYAAVTIVKATGVDPSGVVIADFSGDGLNDIAVTNRGDDTLHVLVNDGSDDFLPAVVVPTLWTPEGLAAADFDGDGDVDLAVTGISPPSLQGAMAVLLNDDLAFTSLPEIELGARPTAVIALDLDGTNGPDIAVADTANDRAAILMNGGVVLRAWAGLRPPVYLSCEEEPSSIQPGNIDNGKETALVLTNFASGSVTVLRPLPGGAGNPADYTSSSGPIGEEPRSLATIDVDDDGSDDIVAVATAPGASDASLRVLTATVLPDGGLQFNSAPDAPTASKPTIVLRADLNDDGREDIVSVGAQTVASRGSHDAGGRGEATNVSASLARPPCPADLVADAAVNTTDLVFFLGRFGQPPLPGSLAFRADFNRDGFVNTSDLVFFLGRFGQACP